MRMFCATAALVVCALMGYADSGTSSAQTRMSQAGITLDETLMLYFDRDKPGLSCTVGCMYPLICA